jgi:hypothetical protein
VCVFWLLLVIAKFQLQAASKYCTTDAGLHVTKQAMRQLTHQCRSSQILAATLAKLTSLSGVFITSWHIPEQHLDLSVTIYYLTSFNSSSANHSTINNIQFDQYMWYKIIKLYSHAQLSIY